ncbi:hypothetical protein IE4872_CH02951 [Rhizobium gallicum]|uniref:Uncharacterized protein n=1 Tax=Rhizobium gallicum TaxID=56730 RepID=A0A1L5NKX8_9HYPH|nr:hypothetical protein IE4872_CH02951 [Rhizobium gallicum]
MAVDHPGDWVRSSAEPMLSLVCSVAGRSGPRAGVRGYADGHGRCVERRACARRALVSGVQGSLASARRPRRVGPASPLRRPPRLYHRKRAVFAGALPSSSGDRFRPERERVRLARAPPSCGSVLGFLLHHRIGTPRPGPPRSGANARQRLPCPTSKPIEFQSQRKTP